MKPNFAMEKEGQFLKWSFLGDVQKTPNRIHLISEKRSTLLVFHWL